MISPPPEISMARCINTCDSQEKAKYACVLKAEYDFYNPAIYLTKDVDTTDGPVMLYRYYGDSFEMAE
eukprot:gene9479-11230_t